jgi:hypothetical protein
MKKVGVTVRFIGLGVVIAMVVYYLLPAALFYQDSADPLPQKAVVTQRSPSGKYVATIVHDERTKSYIFAVEGVDGTRLLLDKQFAPVVGYHEPILSISWVGPEVARVVVDHDFGEGNLVFEFNAKNVSFKQEL